MKKATYLIPTNWNTSSPIEYRYDSRKKDMRTSFCKRNKKYETTDCIIISIVKKYIDRGEARIIGDRLFFIDGVKASLFFKEMKEEGWYK